MMQSSNKETVFLSFDIEAVGPSPATGSMVNLGIVGITIDETVVFQADINLQELSGAKHTLENDAFWNDPKRAEAKAYITRGLLKDPAMAFPELNQSLIRLKEKYHVELVAWPAAYDWQWVNYYFDRFVGSNPLGYTATCIDSYNWGASGQAAMPDMNMMIPVPLEFAAVPIHCGIIDAYRQGVVFVRLWRRYAKI